jgi:thymidylate synthase
MDVAWRSILDHVMASGFEVSPRGKKTRELPQRTVAVNMNFPVLTLPERKLNYRFMAAEALWIVNGNNELSLLTPYNPRMAEFSDDGVTLAGAYGPRILSQFEYVVNTLADDAETRRATLTIWTPNPEKTKDYPCTVAMDFKIRNSKLNCHVFMRSSDIWLGLPYDVFSFTMVACEVLSRYNVAQLTDVTLGTLYITAASMHIYEEHWNAASDLLSITPRPGAYTPLPPDYYDFLGPAKNLFFLKDTKKGDPLRWWEG